jgi:hypothetical protein
MDNLIGLFEIVFPSIIVGAIAFFINSKYLNYEETKEKLGIDRARLEIVVPARMQAYERIILFLERSQPENLVRRVLKSNSPARAFQAELISTVRSEYEHNISQQIYISLTAWSMVKTATEETIRLVNVAGTKVGSSGSATELAEKILEITAQIGKFPTSMAIENIKKEFAQYFLQSTSAKQEE